MSNNLNTTTNTNTAPGFPLVLLVRDRELSSWECTHGNLPLIEDAVADATTDAAIQRHVGGIGNAQRAPLVFLLPDGWKDGEPTCWECVHGNRGAIADALADAAVPTVIREN